MVGNGCVPEQVPAGVRTVSLPENVGIPEGRNIGADRVKGDYLFFFDNDAHLPDTDTLARLVAEFARDPRLAYAQPRLCDPETSVTLRRWVPRLRASDPARPGIVTVMAEGVVMVRRDAYDRAGGWPGHFFLFHEGVELAWRLWDLGCHGRAGRPSSEPCRLRTIDASGAVGGHEGCVAAPPWAPSTFCHHRGSLAGEPWITCHGCGSISFVAVAASVPPGVPGVPR
ncbi:glycosyltransferase family 2 protein [Streptomyces lavendulae]|uniref:glycosyltransferase family 2 protein n=1 Tax=Streptomyces lavendulae TaxID=1914 RepID=UPI0033D8AA51